MSAFKTGKLGLKNVFICLHENDNVSVCIAAIKAGEKIELNGQIIEMQYAVDVGHKIANTKIALAEKVIKYGVSIGSSTSDIALGEHVHTHNMKSDYILSHARDLNTKTADANPHEGEQ